MNNFNDNDQVHHPDAGEPNLRRFIDIHALGVLLQYPYMRSQPNLGLQLPSVWIPVFTQLVVDLDTLLGQDNCGFHWRQMSQEDGKPLWLWRLGEEFYLLTEKTVVNGTTHGRLIIPQGDPDNRLRDSIRQLVKTAVVKAGRIENPNHGSARGPLCV
jgi:hypothetical protein